MICVEPSCSLSSPSLSHPNLVCRRLEICNTGPGDCTAGTGHKHVLDLSVDLTWHLLDPLHLSLCLCIVHDVLITPFREWILLCFISFLQCLCVAVFCQCISPGTSTFMYCCCETSVLCCTFWVYCTCGNFNGLCNVWTIMSMYCTWCISFLCTLNLGSLDLLGHLIHPSG